jgi:hypothetical protein
MTDSAGVASDRDAHDIMKLGSYHRRLFAAGRIVAERHFRKSDREVIVRDRACSVVDELSCTMAGQLIPPLELDPLVRSGRTHGERIAHWADVTNAAEAFFLAGLRRRTRSDAELKNALREAYSEQMREHDEGMLQLMRHVHEWSRSRGRKRGP